MFSDSCCRQSWENAIKTDKERSQELSLVNTLLLEQLLADSYFTTIEIDGLAIVTTGLQSRLL